MKGTITVRHPRTILLALLALAIVACGGGADPSPGPTSPDAAVTGDATNGEAVYLNTCAACHGADAAGVEGLGKTLAGSDFVASESEEALVALVTSGRPASDPLNTTGIDMPPKGGNPSLNEQSIADVVAYLKSLNP